MGSTPGWWKNWKKDDSAVKRGEALAKDLIQATVKDSKATATESGLIIAGKNDVPTKPSDTKAAKDISHATTATGTPPAVSKPVNPTVPGVTPSQYKSSSPTPLQNTPTTPSKPYVPPYKTPAPAKPFVAQTASTASTKKDATVTELCDSIKKGAFKLQTTVDEDNMRTVLEEADNAIWDMWIEQEKLKQDQKDADAAEEAKKKALVVPPATNPQHAVKPATVDTPKASTPTPSSQPTPVQQPTHQPQQQQRPHTPATTPPVSEHVKTKDAWPEDWEAAYAQYM
jgi:hypothetical protein